MSDNGPFDRYDDYATDPADAMGDKPAPSDPAQGVKRYGFVWNEKQTHCLLKEAKNGDYALYSDYAKLEAELERVNGDLVKYMGWFDAAQQNEQVFKTRCTSMREALGSAAHTMTIQANAAANGGGMGHIAVELREAAERARAAAIAGGKQ